MSPPAPSDELERLAALARHEILDSSPEPAFDRLTALAVRVLGVPMASISFVDAERQWLKAAVGLPTQDTPRADAFAAHTILGDAPLVITDLEQDDRFRANPLVKGETKVRFYAGAPLRDRGGFKLGSLCVFDVVGRTFDDAATSTLADLAALVIDLLELRAPRPAPSDADRPVPQATLETVLECSGDGMVISDARGQTIWVNEAAKALGEFGASGGTGASSVQPPPWPAYYGVFQADRVTPCDAESLPLARALRGEATPTIELFVKNPRAPEGRLLALSGRPIRGPAGTIEGGVISLRDVTRLRKLEAELAELVITDEVTGLPNQRLLRQRLDLLVAEGGRGRSFVVVMVDIDHFQKVNDEQGREVGDQVLVSIGAALAGRSRRTDLVTRYGGDEFCILLTDIDEYLALKVVEDLRTTVAGIEKPARVTASLGIAAYSSDLYSAERLLVASTKALARAKNDGRNKVVMHGR